MKTLRKIFTSLDIKYLMGALVIFFFAIVWYSCKKEDVVDQLLTFDISQSDTLKIPAIFGRIDTTINIPTNAKQKAQENGTNTDLIKKAILKELKMTIINPLTQTFNFLDSIKVFISAPSDTTKDLLASKTVIPQDTSMLYLDTDGSDFAQYIKQDTFTLWTQIMTNDTILNQTDIIFDLTFSVTADPLK